MGAQLSLRGCGNLVLAPDRTAGLTEKSEMRGSPLKGRVSVFPHDVGDVHTSMLEMGGMGKLGTDAQYTRGFD